MIHINELCDILPIKCGDKNLGLLTFKDMEWYINNCRSQYYERFMDFKFSSDIQESKLQETIYRMISEYSLRKSSACEARLLLKDTDGDIIYGGCTVYENSTGDLEIAYFVVPKYQNKGLGTQMVRSVCKALRKSNIPFNEITLTVRCDNKASIKLAKNTGFKVKSKVKGKYKKNIIMHLDLNEGA